jgi:hypothetical protein
MMAQWNIEASEKQAEVVVKSAEQAAVRVLVY